MKDMIVYGLLGMIIGWLISQSLDATNILRSSSNRDLIQCRQRFSALAPSGTFSERDVCFIRSFLDTDDSNHKMDLINKYKSILGGERASLIIDLAQQCRETISAVVDSVKFRCTETFPVGSLLPFRSDCTSPRIFGASESSNPLGKSLHKAILETGSSSVIESLIEQGADVNSRDGYNDTPLSSAASRGMRDIIELVLSKGAQIDCQNNYNETALSLAVQNGHSDVAQLLIASRANPNLVNIDGEGPLHLAIEKGNANLVSELLRSGADPNSRRSGGSTPLSECTDVEITQLLVNNGADPTVGDSLGCSPLIYATLDCSFDRIKLLLNAQKKVSAKRTAEALKIAQFVECGAEVENLFVQAGAGISKEEFIIPLAQTKRIVAFCENRHFMSPQG